MDRIDCCRALSAAVILVCGLSVSNVKQLACSEMTVLRDCVDAMQDLSVWTEICDLLYWWKCVLTLCIEAFSRADVETGNFPWPAKLPQLAVFEKAKPDRLPVAKLLERWTMEQEQLLFCRFNSSVELVRKLLDNLPDVEEVRIRLELLHVHMTDMMIYMHEHIQLRSMSVLTPAEKLELQELMENFLEAHKKLG
ncbi:unnamed protein product [Symbiodinium sp. CCMP2592]|nr:unnamed protein product [Symbiodinium sp. CCMP2592]